MARVADVVGSTKLRGIYEILDQFNFTSDETVETARPKSLSGQPVAGELWA